MINSPEPAVFLINQKGGYKGSYPPFDDPAEHRWAAEVEKRWEEIRDELLGNPGFVALNAPHVDGDDGWKAIYLLNSGWAKHRNCQKFPVTMSILAQVPDLTFAAFSMLSPKSRLLPHWGDTNTVIRCHLGIEIPEPAPICALQVADQVRGWQNGKIIMFNECHLHAAWNESDKRRIILSFDSMRPGYKAQKGIICARILAAETLSFLSNNFRFFLLINKYLYQPLYWSATAAWFLYLPLQRRLSFLP